MSTSRVVALLGFIASWMVWIAGNFVWVVSEIGSATGAALFGWLWFPGLMFSITLLFQRTRIGGAKLVGSLAFLASIALAASLTYYDWSRSEYLLRQASAHSGQQVELIETLTLQPWVFIAIGLMVATAFALVYITFAKSPAADAALTTSGATSKTVVPDSRSLWDEQSN